MQDVQLTERVNSVESLCSQSSLPLAAQTLVLFSKVGEMELGACTRR